MNHRIDIAEMPVTKYDGAEIRVSVSLPNTPHTFTDIMIISEEKLDLLKNIVMPEEVKRSLKNTKKSFLPYSYYRWLEEKEMAQKILNMISDEIAVHFVSVLKKANDKSN